MPLPVVAIVGRPNVGKSSLFNWLVGKRISIVDPTAGVTRDRVSSIVEADGRFFDLTDTGGIGIVDSDALEADVEHQIQLAIDKADVIVYMTDARSGPVSLDIAVADRLRPLGKPIICAVNKCDTDTLALQASDFHQFGYQPVIAVSAEQNRGRDKLLDAIVERLPPPDDEKPPADVTLKLAIVGRRNAGKSTFINALAEADRVIVSEIPGTTRDSVDVRFERDGKTFVAIDTAGVRNRSSLANSVEFYGMARAEKSIRRSDVTMLFFDAARSIGRIDKQLTEYILEHHRPAIFVFNKWDLLKGQVDQDKFIDYVKKSFPMLDYVPMAFVTAIEGKNVFRVLNLAQQLAKQARQRVTTGELNRVLRDGLEANPPSQKGKRAPKVFFASQVATEPPTIVIFVNHPEVFDSIYRRYLIKYFRDKLPFPEVPIKLEFRSRHTGKNDRDRDDEAKGEEKAPDGLQAPLPQPAPKPRRRLKKKNKESKLWDV
ncbi:MAG TPA: ribosome biogenesis GTPase Der [Gemmataceae bacterium]|nr:ribosome biogenesis GTPase Der [Gemmataceae bacterium]